MNCKGMALLTGLVFLAAVSLVAITAAGGMTLQRHQAANFTDRAQALSRADLAEASARAWLFSRSAIERQPDCISSCLLPEGIRPAISGDPALEGAAWWRANGTAAGRHPVTGESTGYAGTGTADALWLMEELHFEAVSDPQSTSYAGIGWYRIFARGTGTQPGSLVITETIVARPWGGEIAAGSFPPTGPMSTFCRQFDENTACGTEAWRQIR
jgi:Tfp pilus assembly protein PilX